jgi:hypothetical protein
VIYRKHDDLGRLDDVKNAVREAFEEMAPNVAVNHRRSMRKLRDSFESLVDSIQKLFA